MDMMSHFREQQKLQGQRNTKESKTPAQKPTRGPIFIRFTDSGNLIFIRISELIALLDSYSLVFTSISFLIFLLLKKSNKKNIFFSFTLGFEIFKRLSFSQFAKNRNFW